MSNRSIVTSRGFQKTVAALTSVATLLTLSGFVALAPMVASAASPSDYGLHEGDTISANGSNDPDVYIVNQQGYKRLFLNPVIFSFYGHLGGFANVKNVTPATRDAFPTSGLFRNCESNDQAVWAVEVNGEDTGVFHHVAMTGDAAVAQDPQFFNKVFCINNNEANWYAKSSVDYTSLSQVPVYSRVPGSTPTPTPTNYGPLSVGISSDNPASNTLIAGQSVADLAHFTFTGSGTVTSVVLNRLGVSSDTTLSNVYLYSGTKRLTDAATVSSGKITFSDTAGLFTVNGSTNVSVKSDIASSTSGQTVGVSLASWNGNTVSLSGNLMTIATAPSDFATVAVGAPTPAGTSADVTLDPQKDYNMWQSSVTVGNHDVWLKSLQLRVIGSVVIGDLQNFRLYVDGVQAGTAVALQDANGYLVFDLGSGVKLLAGTRQIKLLGDVIGGSNKKFTISLRQKPDIYVVDTQYGQAVLATGTFPASAPNATYEQSINVGTITITKATDSPSGDVVATATGVKLVSYKFEAFGEPLKFESLRASFTAGGTDVNSLMSLRNGAIYADGVQIGSLASLCEDSVATTASCSAGTAYTEFNLGSSLVVTPGTPRIVDVRADIYDNTGTNNASANDTIIAQIILGSSNVQRTKSLGYFSQAAPAVGSTLTIKTGSFTASKYTGYANQSIVTPQTQYKFGSYNLTAATSEDVNVSAVNLDVSTQNNAGAFTAADMTNVFLKVYNDAGSLVLTTTPKSTIAVTSNSYSVNFTIPKTKVWRVDAYADIGSSTGTDAMVSNLGASGLTAASSTTATAADAAGQTITSATGSLVLNNGSIPANKVTNGGVTSNVYSFTLTPQYDSFTLDDAVFKLSSTLASSSNAVGTAYLKENGVVVSSANIGNPSVSNSISFLGVNRSIPLSDGAKTYTVDVAFSNIGPSYGTDTGGLVLVQLSHLKYRNSAGTITTSTVSPSTYQGNSNYVTAGYPVFTNVGLPSSVLASGTQTLFKQNVTATGGAITWRKVVFTVTATANPTIAGSGWQLFENGVDITSTASTSALSGYGYATASHNFNVASAGTGTVAFVFANERAIASGASTTLELRGNVGGANVAGDSIVTKIANPSGSTFATAAIATSFSPNDGWGSDVNPSFLWSDSSAPSHNTDGTTGDWMGDGLLTGLAVTNVISK